MQGIWGVYVIAILVLTSVAPVRAQQPARGCQSSKLKIAGRYALCRYKAEARSVGTGNPADYSDCDQRFLFKFARAEALAGVGVCPNEGELYTVMGYVMGNVADVATIVAGEPLAVCGNGIVEPWDEDCDFGSLNGATCVTEGFSGGTLSCGAGCRFDRSGCWNVRFVDNADGTITDRQSGLMWEKKVQLDGVRDYTNLHDADAYFPWAGTCSGLPSKYCQPTAAASTLCTVNTEGSTTSCAQCTGGEGTCELDSPGATVWTWAAALNAASFAGHTDWRIPTVAELESIVDRSDNTPPAVNVAFQGPSCGFACPDITNVACSCTNPVYYWSASADAFSSDAAWYVYFDYGSVGVHYGTDVLWVRAVRGGL